MNNTDEKIEEVEPIKIVAAGEENVSVTADQKTKRKKPPIGVIILIAAAAVLFLVCAALVTTLIISRNKSEDAFESENAKVIELEGYKQNAEAELSELNEKLAALESEVGSLNENLDERIVKLNEEIEAKANEIAELNKALESYKSMYSIDVKEQVDLINEITALLDEGAPLHNVREGVDIENVKVGDIDENGHEITIDDLYIYPKISVYYEDIATGFKFTYNSDTVMFSASIIKAMYMVAMLEEVSDEYETAISNRQNPDDPLVFSDEKYDIENQKWVLTDAAKQTGSGVIQDMSAGTEFTYLELVEYAITKSDNTAFAELRRVFGYDSFYALAGELGVTSLSGSFNNLSAEDAGKFLKKIYEFTESDAKYGETLKNYMENSAHNVLIPAAVSPTAVAHKYGWDNEAYHDSAIVYNEKPYVLVIMTDMDEAGDEVNAYIRQIVKLIDKLHNNFYG